MKSLLDVSEKWNRLIDKFGTFATVFVFLSWCTYSIGTNPIALSISFTIGILIGAPNVILAICESVLGIPLLLMIRETFLIPISLPFFEKPFTWWNQQTACAGFATFAIIRLLLWITIKINNNISK